MFNIDREQKVFDIGGAKVGGQPGANPPLVLPSLFQKGDPCVESRRERRFDKKKAAEQIKRLEELSDLTGIPAIVAMVANSGEELGVKHLVTVVMDMVDQSPNGRITALDDMLRKLEPGGFESIIVDTSVMNLPATGICALSNKMVKEKYGLPAGEASANGTYMWQKSTWKDNKDKWGEAGFCGLDAGVQAASVVLWGDFIFSGPMWGNDHVFPAVAAAHSMTSMMRYVETGSLTENEETPIHRLFPDVVKMLKGEE